MANIFTNSKAQQYLESVRPDAVNPISRFYSRDPIRATLERGWANVREVVISANLAQEEPKQVDFDFLDAIIRLGCESYPCYFRITKSNDLLGKLLCYMFVDVDGLVGSLQTHSLYKHECSVHFSSTYTRSFSWMPKNTCEMLPADCYRAKAKKKRYLSREFTVRAAHIGIKSSYIYSDALSSRPSSLR